MGAWRGSFYGLLLEGARMDRLREGEARIIPMEASRHPDQALIPGAGTPPFTIWWR